MANDIIEYKGMTARNSILDVGQLRGQLVSGECKRVDFLKPIYQSMMIVWINASPRKDVLPSGAFVHRRARVDKLFASLLVVSTRATTPLTTPITSMAC